MTSDKRDETNKSVISQQKGTIRPSLEHRYHASSEVGITSSDMSSKVTFNF